jgi:GDPmannose 4,6-dehydratase
LRFLEAIRILGLKDKTRFYQASTSELYGKVVETPQSEETPFYPRSPYGVAKLYGYWIVKNYREAYGIHASNGILFNHESPLRGETFVTRKITRGLSRVFTSGKGELTLGNMDSVRDWGHAKDYVRAMYLIANHKVPSDWVVSTGVGVTVREFVLKCALYCGVELVSEGAGESEILSVKAVIMSKWESMLPGIHPPVKGKVIVRVDPKFYRPTEVDLLIGDSTKIRKELGWKNEYSVEDLLEDMMSNDLNSALKTTFIKAHGFQENQSLEDIL